MLLRLYYYVVNICVKVSLDCRLIKLDPVLKLAVDSGQLPVENGSSNSSQVEKSGNSIVYRVLKTMNVVFGFLDLKFVAVNQTEDRRAKLKKRIILLDQFHSKQRRGKTGREKVNKSSQFSESRQRDRERQRVCSLRTRETIGNVRCSVEETGSVMVCYKLNYKTIKQLNCPENSEK